MHESVLIARQQDESLKEFYNACGHRALRVPTLFWSGREDPYHDAMQDLAYTEGFPFLSTPGTHLSAIADGAQDALPDILRFLQGA